MPNKQMNRRTLLKGIGSVAIAFPFLEEMMLSSALASTPIVGNEPPIRAFNVFFGLGIPAPLQEEGFAGVLEPLKPLSEKLLIMKNIDQVRCDESGINAHFDGASGAFTAEPPDGDPANALCRRNAQGNSPNAMRRNVFQAQPIESIRS